jgi:cell division protein FtsA
VDAGAIETLLLCLKRCDLECAGLASSAYVSGIASLVEDEQELGAACIDMGGGSTGLSVFIRKHMIYADCVRMGGHHVTSDISMGLQVPAAVAERIKTVHGGVQATGRTTASPSPGRGGPGGLEHDRRAVSRTELSGSWRPRVAEILEEVRAKLDRAFRPPAVAEHRADRGRVAESRARRARPRAASWGRRCGSAAAAGAWAAAEGHGGGVLGADGLSLFAAHPQDEWWDFEIPAGPAVGAVAAPRGERGSGTNW